MTISIRIGCAVLILCASTFVAANEPAARPILEKKFNLNIPSQPLADALHQFSVVTGLKVMFLTNLGRGVMAPKVSGTLTPEAGLHLLLGNAPLRFRYLDDQTVAVLPARESTSDSEFRPMSRVSADSIRLASAASTMEEKSDQSSAMGGESAASRSMKDPGIQEIVVTAQKREERLIDVPQSLSVLSANALAKQDAVNLSDFANSVPGLSFTTLGVGQNQVMLRGVTSGGSDNSPTVGIYVDEVPYGSSTPFALSGRFGIDVGLFDLDRIEVLRGPQGTLYGASSIGGVLKYVTTPPNTKSFSADTRLGVSDTGSGGGVNYTGAAGVNMPLVQDKAAVRLNGYYAHDAGFIDYDGIGTGHSVSRANRSYIDGARADFLLTPADTLNIRLTGFIQNISRGADSQIDLDLDPSSRTSGSRVSSLTQRRGYPGSFQQQYRLVSGTVTYDLPLATLTSVSSYQTMLTNSVADGTAGFVPILNSIGLGPYSALADSAELSLHKFTQEVRLASPHGELFDWLIGGFYTHETAGDSEAFITRDLADQPVQNGLYTYGLPSTFDEYAAFGDLTWHVSGKFDVTAGLRYARDHQGFQQYGSGLFGAGSPRFTSDEGDLTYLANARYRFTDHTAGYVRYATGYRPGGPAIHLPSNSTAPDHFKSDRLRSYEIGMRTETVDRRFTADLSVYAIDWSDIQVFKIVDGFGTFTNSTSPAHIQGSELALSARIGDGLVMTGAFAYQHAYMVDADPVLGASAGERTPNVPRITGTVSADYEIPLGGLQPSIGGTVRYVSGRNAGYNNSTSIPQYYLPRYAATDVRAGVVFDSIQLQLYVHNVFDERGQLNATLGFLQSPYAAVSILQPRTVGVSATVHF